MKTIVKILFVVVISIFSCDCSVNTETQIKNKLKLTGFYGTDITKIDVIDTIYQNDIDSIIRADTIRLGFLKERVREFDQIVDSIRKTPRPEYIDPIKIKYIKEIFDSLMMYNRLVDMTNERELLYQRMNHNYYDNYLIRGYRVIVHYENDRTNEMILGNDYSYVCASFMFDSPDSILWFKPRQHRKMLPPKLMINDSRHDNLRQRFGK